MGLLTSGFGPLLIEHLEVAVTSGRKSQHVGPSRCMCG